MPIRVLLADDSPCILSAVRRMLQKEPRITIIGEALVFSGIMQMIGDFKPEVLLFDLHMPEKRNPLLQSLPVANYSASIARALEWLGDRYLLARPMNASRSRTTGERALFNARP